MGKEQERAARFAGELAGCYGDNLISVVLYGSAARGDYREGVSDLNVLVVLRTLDAAELRRGAELARAWVTEGNPPPLMMDQAEWRASADVFPIEYTDIRDAHRILAGEDPFAGLQIHWEHLRLQCEHELKGKKIQLRERYMLAAQAPEELGTLLIRSFPTFLALFRAGLRLAGDSVPRDAPAVVRATADRAGFPAEPLLRIHQARSGGERFAPAAGDPVVEGYLHAVARAAAWLDGLRSPGGSTLV